MDILLYRNSLLGCMSPFHNFFLGLLDKFDHFLKILYHSGTFLLLVLLHIEFIFDNPQQFPSDPFHICRAPKVNILTHSLFFCFKYFSEASLRPPTWNFLTIIFLTETIFFGATTENFIRSDKTAFCSHLQCP